MNNEINKNPDILNCLANLSSDEVFTPPELVNRMLDLLPQELFTSKNTTFLDPCCKSGVFLREIAKRLIKGLENEIPDLQERVNWIMTKQIYGIPLTDLTAKMTRRTLYCSRHPNGKYSIVTSFDEENKFGNICSKVVNHDYDNSGKCKKCGASKEIFKNTKEKHAYYFIHANKPKEIFNMKFDVIIGNPPYQLNDGGAQASAKPIYQLFIETAIKLNPKYISMIIPSRWFTGGKGLDKFRDKMLKDRRMEIIHDFPNASECFPGVDIKGGVNYFLWDREHDGMCEVNTHINNEIISSANRYLLEDNCDVFIRNNELVSIFKKVQSFKEESFMKIVSSRKPFGLCGDFFKNPRKYNLPKIYDTPILDGLSIYGLDEQLKRITKYVPLDYPLPKREYLGGYKMFMSRNQGTGFFGETFSTPIFAKPNECCTETFVVIGPFKNENQMINCYSYIKTKFFRAMIGVKKNDQSAAQGVYQYVPIQDFTKSWTDEELYKKYKLSNQEINFIETSIKSMD